MRALRSAVLFLSLVGCGYVGPVQPPSPELPTVITDLAAVEVGDKIIVTFTAPPRTTDGVAITHFSHIDLRIGPDSQSLESDKPIDVDLPPPNDRESPQPIPVAHSIDATPWVGQRIAVAVRAAVKKSGHFSSWSNRATLNIIPALEKPVVHAQGSGNGIILTWPATAAAEYRIERQGPSDKQPVEVGTTAQNQFVDSSALYDTDYRYFVTGLTGAARSLPSAAIPANFPDIYPPADPTGLTALAGPDSIDLAWQRNTESDLQGYHIYRSVNGGAFQRLPDVVALPTYTDHAVEHGKAYAYKVTAFDKKGNESAASNAADVQF